MSRRRCRMACGPRTEKLRRGWRTGSLVWLDGDRCKMVRTHGEIQVKGAQGAQGAQGTQGANGNDLARTLSTQHPEHPYALLIHSAIQSPTSRVPYSPPRSRVTMSSTIA